MIGKGGHFIGRDFIASRNWLGFLWMKLLSPPLTKFVKQITTFSIFINISTSVPSTNHLTLGQDLVENLRFTTGLECFDLPYLLRLN